MGVDLDREGVFFADLHNELDRPGDLVDRHDHIVRQGDQTDQAHRFLTVAAHIPDTFVSFQHVDSTGFAAQFVQLLHFQVQLVFTEGLDRDDNINAVLIMGRALKFQIIGRAAHIRIVHIFHAGRIDAGLHDLRHYVQSLDRVIEHSQQIKAVRRDRLQFKRRFGNDAQSALTAHDQLFQTVTRRTFFQTGAQLHDLARRRYQLHCIHLIASHAVTHRLIAARIGGKVTADQTAFSAAGVARIQKTCFVGIFLDIDSAHTGLDFHIHTLGIQLKDLIQTFH